MIGTLLLIDAVVTLVWQEPVSALYSKIEQSKLGSDLAKLENTEPTAADRQVLDAARHARPQARLRGAHAQPPHRRRPAAGPHPHAAIGVDSVVVAGTDTSSLRRGPGHYPGTPLPGARGTVAIAGHRTTYGAPFRRLDKLDDGDRITLNMPYGRFVYAVERKRIVPPTATWVTQRVRYDRLDPERLPPAVLGGQADRRVRAAGGHETPQRPACLSAPSTAGVKTR